MTILNHQGKPLKLSEDSDDMSISDEVSEYQHSVERKLQRTLEELLERTVGLGKVKVNVAAEINLDKEVLNSEIYDPDQAVARSRKVTEESEKEVEGNSTLTVTNNLPDGGAEGGGASKQSQ